MLVHFLLLRRDSSIFKELDINERIRDREIRLISDTGEQLGVVPLAHANRLADEKNLDLVKISPTANPPVCKIMDYGKFRFDQIKKEKDAKKNQRTTEMKEVWLSMTIERHDLETKAKTALKFISAGDKVKVSIKMRGRQQAHASLGVKVMHDFFAIVEDTAVMEKSPLTEGRNILMIIAPKK